MLLGRVNESHAYNDISSANTQYLPLLLKKKKKKDPQCYARLRENIIFVNGPGAKVHISSMWRKHGREVCNEVREGQIKQGITVHNGTISGSYLWHALYLHPS